MKATYRKPTRYSGIVEIGERKYEIRVNLGRDLTTNEYKQRQRTASNITLGEARAIQKDMDEEVNTGGYSTSSWTVGRLVEEYFKYIEDKLGFTTVKAYRSIWRVLAPAMENILLRDLNPYRLDQVFDALQRSRGIKPQTINRYRTMLMSAFTQGKRWGVVKSNPVKETLTRRADPFDVDLPSTDQIGWVLDAYEVYSEWGHMLALALELAWLNSLREGEVCGLRIRDFNEESLSLTVEFQPHWEGGRWWLGPLKTRQRRVIQPLDHNSIAVLKELIGDRTDPNAFILSKDGGTSPIRPGWLSHSQGRVRSRVCPQCGKYDTKSETCVVCNVALGCHFRVHDLRGWMTTYLNGKGRSKGAQARGGWQDEHVMKLRYNHYTDGEGELTTQEINALTESIGRSRLRS